MRRVLAINIAVLFCMVSLVPPPSAGAGPEKINLIMGATRIAGPYYPTAGRIAGAFNHAQGRQGWRITIRTNRPSTAILSSVVSGEYGFGVVPLSRVHQAYQGLGHWDGRPQVALRSVLNVQSERIAIAALPASGIRTLSDLKGRRVAIGAPGSDLNAIAAQVVTAAGMGPGEQVTMVLVSPQVAPAMLQDGAIDAFFFVMGTMDRAFLELAASRSGLHLVSIAGPGIMELIDNSRYLERLVVPGGLNPVFANSGDAAIIGVKTCLITAAQVPVPMVYAVAEAAFGNLDTFRDRYPSTVTMTRDAMAQETGVPFHPGAAQFLSESGPGFKAHKP